MSAVEMTRLHKITSICFTLFILSSGISITFSQGMLILSLGLWLSGIIRKNPDFRYNRTGLEIYIGQFIIVSAVLALLSQSRIDNLLYLKDFWLISAFVVASSLIKTKDDLIKVFYLFVVVAAFQSAAAIIQYFVNINYLNAFRYGHGHWQAKLPMGRIVMGFLGHHLTFGGYMMMISLPVFYLAFVKKIYFNKLQTGIIRGAAVTAFITIIMSWARSVIIAMPFAIAPVILRSRKKFFIASGIIAALIIIIFSVFGPYGNLEDNIYNTSSTIRITIWKHAFNLFKRHPITGTGGGNYNREFELEVKSKSGIDDQYYTALDVYKKSVRRLNNIKTKKDETADLLIKTIDDLGRAELALLEADNQYWGMEEFSAEEEWRYKSVHDKFLSVNASLELIEAKHRNAEKKHIIEKEIFESVEKTYNRADLNFLKDFPSLVTHAHNDYLNQLVRKGIIGLLSFLFMLYGILKYMFDNMKSINDRFLRYFYMGLFGSCTAFLAASIFQCYYTDDETLVMLWLNIGILAGIVRVSGKDGNSSPVT